MPSEDTGIVRVMFRAMGALSESPDVDAFGEIFFHPDVTYTEDPSWPGADEFQGRAAVMEHFREYLDFLSMQDVELEEVLEGPNHLVALWTLRARGSGSGAAAEAAWAWLIRMKDGYVHRFSAHLDRSAALRAAGIAAEAAE
jgi:ketosteroid isomerase-like protein